MTSNNPNFVQQSGLSVTPGFFDFIQTSVIPATTLNTAQFWEAFASLVTKATSSNTCATCESQVMADYLTIPVRTCSEPVNATWGSLYDALYKDNVIRHSAGLKPGSRINIARRDRVIRCGKDFLDNTFPLSEGSHRDAVSYMAYFQNLLVILADGSTTGLQNPKQYVAKNGPSDAPDSILLEHNGTHTEIFFDRNGKIGATDLAFIDDIQLETTQRSLFDFHANSATEKCNTYNNWIAIVRSQRNRTVSSRNGEQRTIKNDNWAITSTDTGNPCTLLLDQNNNTVPDAIVDAITAAIIESAYSDNLTAVSLCIADTNVNDEFVAELQQLLAIINKSLAVSTPETIVKVISTSADNRAKPARPVIGTMSDSECVPSPLAATIGAMRSHGYDVTQATAL